MNSEKNNILPPEQSDNEVPDNRKGSLTRGTKKLSAYDWMHDISDILEYRDYIEVQFKNTRKGFYHNVNNLRLSKGDVVAVEASPGHDIGRVSLTGQLVLSKMLSEGVNPKETELKKIYRKAKPADIKKWDEAIALEDSTMLRSRKIAENLKLDMKIGDVEYQGDKTKAIFYYIADERVDFRELIKLLADEFKIRVEMRQIGARQEAGRIGGIGACGRELCCSSYITNFVSVTTSSARYQEVSLNPQKLAGQCSKLKCCLNYELDVYLDAQEDFPNTAIPLETKQGKATHQKTDVFKRLMWYSLETDKGRSLTCLSVDTVKEIIEQNEKGQKPEKLKGIEEASMASVIDYQNSVGVESLTRFEDKPDKNSKSSKHSKKQRYKKRKFRPKSNKNIKK